MKRTTKPRWAAVTAAAAAALALTACGGGGGDDEGTATQADPTLVPASATSSIAAFFAFTGALASSETAEPLALTQASTAPVSETDEPVPLPR